MLLDIQGDLNAIKNTINELEKLSDEEKAKEITMKHFEITEYCFENLLPNKDFVYNFFKGVLKGLAEGRKEGYEQGKNNERKLQCGKKNYEKDIAILEKENSILKSIISTILDKDDICYICKMKGQVLPECMRMENSECLKNMISLWSK